jgi:SAM-dependent methyltransferase
MYAGIRRVLHRLLCRLVAARSRVPDELFGRNGQGACAITQSDPVDGVMEVNTFLLFFSFCRIHAVFSPAVALDAADQTQSGASRVALFAGGVLPQQKSICKPINGAPNSFEIVVDAMVDRALVPTDGTLQVTIGGREYRFFLSEIMRLAVAFNVRSLRPTFDAKIAASVADPGPRSGPPKILDIGGRARSGSRPDDIVSGCEITVFDILADPGVDVVGDAHELSRYFPHGTFDFAVCVSVFEHLLMPWKVALELNHVMKPGGIVFIHTHQTIGVHDVPWDFYRYSDTCWQGLFNTFTGFEILETSLSNWMHIVPRAWQSRYSIAEQAGGFDSSAVMVRKVGEPRVRWDVPLLDVLNTSYPTHPDNNPR